MSALPLGSVRRVALAFALAVPALGAHLACSDEAISPVSTGHAEAPIPDGGFKASPPPVDAGPFRRTVSVRNPLGGPVGNLMADGDFELSTQGENQAGQLGWRAFDGSGANELNLKNETGGLCRTGLRCGVLVPGMILFGRGAAANGGAGNIASVWVKPAEGEKCSVASAVLVGCDDLGTYKLLTPDKQPREDGWCQYQAHISAQDTSICLYVQSKVKAGMTALIDSAVLVPDDGTTQKSLTIGGVDWAPTAELVESLAALQGHIRRRTRFGPPPIWDRQER